MIQTRKRRCGPSLQPRIREDGTMNDHSLLVVGLGAPTKICRAIVVSARVIFASSTGGNAEDAWSEIKASAKEWKETSDYFVAARDDIEIATTLAKAFGLIDQPDDQKKL